MKINFALVIIFKIVLMSQLVAQNTNSNISQSQNKLSIEDFQFINFFHAIPVLKLPIVIDCDGYHCPNDSLMFPKIESIYYSELTNVVGRIFPSKEFISILYNFASDDGFPFLITYNKTGNKIDSLALKNIGCIIDPEFEGKILTKIISETEIVKIDTLIKRLWDPNYENIIKSDTTISQQNILLTKDGRFYSIDIN